MKGEISDHDIEVHLRHIVVRPMQFDDIALEFYGRTKLDIHDAELWHRFWCKCRELLREVGHSLTWEIA